MKRSNYDQQKYIAVDGGKDSGDLSFYCFFFLAALIYWINAYYTYNRYVQKFIPLERR